MDESNVVRAILRDERSNKLKSKRRALALSDCLKLYMATLPSFCCMKKDWVRREISLRSCWRKCCSDWPFGYVAARVGMAFSI